MFYKSLECRGRLTRSVSLESFTYMLRQVLWHVLATYAHWDSLSARTFFLSKLNFLLLVMFLFLNVSYNLGKHHCMPYPPKVNKRLNRSFGLVYQVYGSMVEVNTWFQYFPFYGWLFSYHLGLFNKELFWKKIQESSYWGWNSIGVCSCFMKW